MICEALMKAASEEESILQPVAQLSSLFIHCTTYTIRQLEEIQSYKPQELRVTRAEHRFASTHLRAACFRQSFASCTD